MSTETFTLTDTTTGQTWSYGSERQLRTVTMLHSRSNPKHGIKVNINGAVTVLR